MGVLQVIDSPLTGNIIYDSLMGGTQWHDSLGGKVTLTFSFPWTTNPTAYWAGSYSYDNEPNAAVHFGLTSEQMTAARNALQSWANVANITFTEVQETSSVVGDIRFAFSSAVSDDAWGWSYLPSTSAAAGDIWISPSNKDDSFAQGTYNFDSLIHELGHTLGLKHPGNYNGSGSGTGPFLPSAQDNLLYSIMSYNEPSLNYWIKDGYVYQYTSNITPMVYDIAVIQHLYGANMSYHTGDDVYTFDNLGIFRMAIWDAGGNDTISVSTSHHSCLIDLREGAYSSIQTDNAYSFFGSTNGTFHSTYDGTYNLGIAYGAVIENAIGGYANDKLIGNSVNNFLSGGAGDDTLIGGAGSDTLNGGDGKDTFCFDLSSATDTIQDFTGYDCIQVNSFTSFDWVHTGNGSTVLLYQMDVFSANNLTTLYIGLDNISGYDLSINLTGTFQYDHFAFLDSTLQYYDPTSITYTSVYSIGTTANNILYGKFGNDVLNGGVGADKMYGSFGNDTYYVDNTLDVVTEIDAGGVDSVSSTISYTLGAFVENLTLTGTAAINATGNTLNNTLIGNSGANILDGKEGADVMIGGLGNDTYIVDNAGDSVTETSALLSEIDTVKSSITYTLGANLENLTLTGTSDINATGNTLNNTLIGNSGANVLNGGIGTDTMNGGDGADTFVFMSALNNVTNVDTISDFETGIDTIQLENAIFTKLTSIGALSSWNFINVSGSQTATDTNDYIIYHSDTGVLSYDLDGSGNGVEIKIALLGTDIHPTLTANDFLIV